MGENVKNKEVIEEIIARLRDKGVHTVLVALGEISEESTAFFERLVAHPSDISHIENVSPRHILGDVARTVCRKVMCEEDDKDQG